MTESIPFHPDLDMYEHSSLSRNSGVYEMYRRLAHASKPFDSYSPAWTEQQMDLVRYLLTHDLAIITDHPQADQLPLSQVYGFLSAANQVHLGDEAQQANSDLRARIHWHIVSSMSDHDLLMTTIEQACRPHQYKTNFNTPSLMELIKTLDSASL